MGIFRTYFSKDTTIIRNSCVNTGRNPIIELFHGGSTNVNDLTYTRYLFNIDLTDLQTKLANQELSIDNLTHKINLTNTSCFDEQLYCKTYCGSIGEVSRAVSFDLILFKVPEFWDEGNGYDYAQTSSINGGGDKVFCESPANWLERETGESWLEMGVYEGDPTLYTGGLSATTATTENLVIDKQHFDHGNENICLDLTTYINDLLLSGETEVNLGIAFDYPEEGAPNYNVCYTGFFGKDTNTVYEPYLESSFDHTIMDDRDNFFLDKENTLYLYVNAGGEPTNAQISGVTIYDQNDDIYLQIPTSGITQTTTGVYSTTFTVSGDTSKGICGNIQFKDVWEGVTVDGNNLGDVELEFVVKEPSKYYNIGATNSATANGLGVGVATNKSIYEYGLSFTGIKRQEKIKRGDTRRINVNVLVPLKIDQTETIGKLYYRLFIKEGRTQIEYSDWALINRTPDGNYFIMDTSWLIPNDYFLEFKIESGNEIRTYEDIVNFEIVSEKDWC
jgi:hypothetical protein